MGGCCLPMPHTISQKDTAIGIAQRSNGAAVHCKATFTMHRKATQCDGMASLGCAGTAQAQLAKALRSPLGPGLVHDNLQYAVLEKIWYNKRNKKTTGTLSAWQRRVPV